MHEEKNEEWWEEVEEEEGETPDYPPGKEVTARPVHPTPVPWRQGGVDREEWKGATHLSPGELAIGGMRDELKREGGRTAEKHTCPLTFKEIGKGMCTCGFRGEAIAPPGAPISE